MNFSEEYIKECDCPEIQGLRKTIEYADWFYNKELGICVTKCIHFKIDRDNAVWLPTSGQLDEEIVKICKKINCDYQIGTCTKPDYGWWGQINSRDLEDPEDIILIEVATNPLIAKIRLLKQLLEEK